MKRDVLTARRGLSRREPERDRDTEPEGPPIEVSVRPEYDEPTWEVRQPGTGRRRLDGRTRSILCAALAAAVVANAGVAWAYWKINGSRTSSAPAGTPVEMILRGRSDLNRPLTGDGTGNLTVTLTNDNDFPIRITSVSRAAGNVVADAEHRDAGCTDARGVAMARDSYSVSWEVARNTIGAFTIPDGLSMARNTSRSCWGATFTVPIRAVGVSG